MRALFASLLFVNTEDTYIHIAYECICVGILMLMISDLFLTMYRMYCLVDSIPVALYFWLHASFFDVEKMKYCEKKR